MKYILFALVGLVAMSCNNGESLNGDDLFEVGDFEGAIEAYTSYLATHPDHKKSLYNRGRSFEEVGETAKAVADFETLIELDPKYINAYLSLAKVSYNKRDYNKVLIYTSDAIDLNENSQQAHFLAGRAEHQLGYFDQALESYNNAIAINKDFGEAYLYRGAVRVGQKKMGSACEDFKFAKSLDVPEADKAIKDYCK